METRLMKNLFRGVAIMSLFSFCVVFIYAQAKTEPALATAINSQPIILNNITDNVLIEASIKSSIQATIETQDNKKKIDDKKKLVKTTASVKSSGSGASRGAYSATAYCLSGRTAMGHGVRRGIIAADPRVLKLGSKITIKAGPYSGTYLVSDTGGVIKGKKLDIWMPSCTEARRFGRRSVQVFSEN